MRRRIAVRHAVATLVAGSLALGAAPSLSGGGARSASADAGLAEQAALLESYMDDHLQYGQVVTAYFGDDAQTPGNVTGVSGNGDSAIWTGTYLAGEAARFEVATATGDADEAAAAAARIAEVADALHRNINISSAWGPSSECGADNLPTVPDPTTGFTPPHDSCGVTADGVTSGEPGRLFRNCFPKGDPLTHPESSTHPMVFGPLHWQDSRWPESTEWYCEDGVSRDQYDGVTFGLTAALDAVAGQPGMEALTAQIAGDLMTMTSYLVRHGWSMVYPHTRVSTEGSENFVFPLFVYVPTARLNMAVTALHAANIAGTPDQVAFFTGVWEEEWAHFGQGQITENLLAIQSPHQSYYVMNLQHLTSYNIFRYAPDAATQQAEKAFFAVIDETTRDDLNAHFETLTYAMTGERWRHDLAVEHLAEWVTYRERNYDGVAYATPERCEVDFACVPEDEVNWYQDTQSDAQRVATQPGASDTLRAQTPRPVIERVAYQDFLWQRSPYQLAASQPANPRQREPGVDFLTPYWMLRYYEQVAPPAVTGMPDWAGPHTETHSPGWSGPNQTTSVADQPAPGEGPEQHLIGSLHEHSSYSDGWYDTRPEDYYRSGKGYGLDFMGGADHSDTLSTPVSVSQGCLEGTDVGVGQDAPTNLAYCVPGDPDQPTDGLTKWEATKRQAAEVSDDTFTAFQGFEWTSDRYDHIDVFFSENETEAKRDGGYADMDTFWSWFTRSPELGGGADGIMTFNHPGSKSINQGPLVVDGDEQRNWNDFEYHPEADPRVVGIEVFNDDRDYGTRTNSLAPEGFYSHALDKGWHVGPIGAEDLGHDYDDAYGDDDDNWGGPVWAKTVVIADQNTPAAIKAAMLQRRFYAVGHNENDLRLDFTVDGRPMGSRVSRREGSAVLLQGRVNRPEGLTLELVTSGGNVVATSNGQLALAVPVTTGETWYHLRARRGGTYVAYSAPVWINATASAVQGEWLAGDLHVHTCYSHDGWCGPDDDNTTTLEYEVNPDHPEDTDFNSEFYTLSGDIDERFTEASVRGLDYLAITDHNDVRSVSDPDFGSHGVIGIAGYENSLSGHAQMLGARKLYGQPGTASGVNAIADALRADGGVFQINHPSDDVAQPLAGCEPSDLAGYDWGHGTKVVPDTMEVFNVSHLLQPPMPANSNNDNSEAFWECFLNAGYHVGATGGSDSHWLSTMAVQGVGNPTTWVLASERSERGVLQALREGRTSISSVPPALGGAPLLLEADSDGDGIFESSIGDTVAPGSTMRARSASPSASGMLVIRANGETIVEEPMAAGGAVTFTGPDRGWVRAKLVDIAAPDAAGQLCDPLDDQSIPFADEPLATTYCDNQLLVNGVTSPIYVERVPTTLLASATAAVHATDALSACGVLVSSEGYVADAQLTFTLGASSATATTGADGAACATLAADVDAGAQEVLVGFPGSARYAPAVAAAPVAVVLEPVTLVYVGESKPTGATLEVAARLTEHDGVPIAGATVVFDSGSDSISAVTDADGIARGTLPFLLGPEATVTVTYAGSAVYEAGSTSAEASRRP